MTFNLKNNQHNFRLRSFSNRSQLSFFFDLKYTLNRLMGSILILDRQTKYQYCRWSVRHTSYPLNTRAYYYLGLQE